MGAGGNGEERGSGKDGLLYMGDASFATKLLAGVKAGKGESWARCEFHDYTQGLLNLLLDKEACFVDELSSASLAKVVVKVKRVVRSAR